MESKLSKRKYGKILQALSNGTVPHEGLGYIAVGRERELGSLLNDLELLKSGGSTFRIVVGDYGSGKSFLLQTIRENAVKRNFVVAEADLSPDKNLVGTATQKKGLATYRELIANISNKTNQDGHALRKILDSWSSNMYSLAVQKCMNETHGSVTNLPEYTKKLVQKKCMEIADLPNGHSFAKALETYWECCIQPDENTLQTKDKLLRWFQGDYETRQESMRNTGLDVIVDDENWFDYIKLWSVFFKLDGYDGFLVLVDELINIYHINRTAQRLQNYEKMLSIYNDTTQGKVEHLGFVFAGTPKCVIDDKKGLFSYGALQSRLAMGSYKQPSVNNVMGPLISLVPLTKEEMYVLLERLVKIHSAYHEYQPSVTSGEIQRFVKLAYVKRETVAITPRTMIRDFVQILDSKLQNPEATIDRLVQSYQFTRDEQNIDEN